MKETTGYEERLTAIKLVIRILSDKRNARAYSTTHAENGETVTYDELNRWVNEIYKDILFAKRSPSNRVMTMTELLRHIDGPDGEVRPLFTEYNPPISTEYVRRWRSAGSLRRLVEKNPNGYGVTWRCWTGDPSDKEREAEKWKRR